MSRYTFLCDMGCDNTHGPEEITIVAGNESQAREFCYQWLDEHTTPASSLMGPFPRILALTKVSSAPAETERFHRFMHKLSGLQGGMK